MDSVSLAKHHEPIKTGKLELSKKKEKLELSKNLKGSDCTNMGQACSSSKPCCPDTTSADRTFVCVLSPSFDKDGDGRTCSDYRGSQCLPDYCRTWTKCSYGCGTCYEECTRDTSPCLDANLQNETDCTGHTQSTCIWDASTSTCSRPTNCTDLCTRDCGIDLSDCTLNDDECLAKYTCA